jgi:hypothetical protein
MGELINLSQWHEGVQQQPGLPAVIRSPGVQSLAATVTDRSAEGACIETPAVPLPSFFVLEIAGEGIERICRVVSRDERRVVVRFVNARTMGRSRRSRPAPAQETVTPYRSTAAQ